MAKSTKIKIALQGVRKIYLSVDLDFWERDCCSSPTTELGVERACYNFLVAMRDSGKMVAMVDEHHRLLPSINRSRRGIIVNVDQHSDIAENDEDYCFQDGAFVPISEYPRGANEIKAARPQLNCGTWANHVKRRDHFIWVCPTRHHVGCHDLVSPFENPKVAAWKKATCCKVANPSLELIDLATHIGLSMSYEYVGGDSLLPFIVKKVFGRRPRRSRDGMKYWEPELAECRLRHRRKREIYSI